MRMGEDKIVFIMAKAMKHPDEPKSCSFIDVVDDCVEQRYEEILTEDELEAALQLVELSENEEGMGIVALLDANKKLPTPR